MPLKFAYNWNRDWGSSDQRKKIMLKGREFGYTEARAVVKASLTHNEAGALKQLLDTGLVRVITGPHISPKSANGKSDRKLHITVTIFKMSPRTDGPHPVHYGTYHLNVSDDGTFKSLSKAEAGEKLGNPYDDNNAPQIATSADL
jgi:hypothetical protein